LPLRSAKRGSAAILSDDVRAFPSGLKIIMVSPCSVRSDYLTFGFSVVEIDSYWHFTALSIAYLNDGCRIF
jgi:hypothetical protein